MKCSELNSPVLVACEDKIITVNDHLGNCAKIFMRAVCIMVCQLIDLHCSIIWTPWDSATRKFSSVCVLCEVFQFYPTLEII